MSDGAAAVILMSRAKAEALGIKPLVRFIRYAEGGVPPEIMGIGPVVAIPKVLKETGMSSKEIGMIELNEAEAIGEHIHRFMGKALEPKLRIFP